MTQRYHPLVPYAIHQTLSVLHLLVCNTCKSCHFKMRSAWKCFMPFFVHSRYWGLSQGMAWQRASDGHRKIRANDSWVHGRFFTTCFQNGKCDVLAHVGLISSWYMSWWVLMDLWWSLWSCCAVAAFCPNWDIALYDPFPVFSCGKIPKLPSPHKYRIVTHQTWFLCKEWKPVIAETWNWDLRSRFGMLPQPQQHIVYLFTWLRSRSHPPLLIEFLWETVWA